jgi:hypothetical protein
MHMTKHSGEVQKSANSVKNEQTANLANSTTATPPRPAPAGTEEPATQTTTVAENKQEANLHMGGDKNEKHEHNDPGCVECRRRELRIVNLAHELDNLRKTNTALEQKLNSNEDRAYEIPDLSTVIHHCESGECDSHASQWDRIKARIVQSTLDNLPPAVIPDKVIESEGLKRGFIPQRIIIPVSR